MHLFLPCVSLKLHLYSPDMTTLGHIYTTQLEVASKQVTNVFYKEKERERESGLPKVP